MLRILKIPAIRWRWGLKRLPDWAVQHIEAPNGQRVVSALLPRCPRSSGAARRGKRGLASVWLRAWHHIFPTGPSSRSAHTAPSSRTGAETLSAAVLAWLVSVGSPVQQCIVALWGISWPASPNIVSFVAEELSGGTVAHVWKRPQI